MIEPGIHLVPGHNEVISSLRIGCGPTRHGPDVPALNAMGIGIIHQVVEGRSSIDFGPRMKEQTVIVIGVIRGWHFFKDPQRITGIFRSEPGKHVSDDRISAYEVIADQSGSQHLANAVAGKRLFANSLQFRWQKIKFNRLGLHFTDNHHILFA